MKTSQFFLIVLGTLAVAARTNAQTLYGATSSGSGELYILNPATGGIVQDVGALNDSSAKNYSVTGLAFNPVTGLLYGSTGGASGTDLLSINPATGLVNVIGSFNVSGHSGATMSDIAFDQSGNLFGIGSSGGPTLYSISLGTGQARAIGSSGLTFTIGGGLAISSAGVFYGGPINGSFGTYNSSTGAYSNIGTPTYPEGASSSFAALAFDGSTLYGDNLQGNGGTGASHLVTIDTATGNVTDIGASVTHLDAIAFTAAPEPTTLALAGLGGLSLLLLRRQKSNRLTR